MSSLRSRVRLALGLRDIEPWWTRGKDARQKRFQLALGINILALAVGLPVVWGKAVELKKSLWRSRDPDELLWQQAQREHELRAVQLQVNARRAARGLAPYPYSTELASEKLSVAGESLFRAVEALRRAPPPSPVSA